jgi:1-phosphatidylinositol-4-phosphate 5-kinase
LKGSEFDREVLIKKPQSDLSKVTLKDLDFVKTEERIWIDNQMADCIPMHKSADVSNILLRDSRFFKLTQLIDYSLLVLKVDWNRYARDTGRTP